MKFTWKIDNTELGAKEVNAVNKNTAPSIPKGQKPAPRAAKRITPSTPNINDQKC